MKLLIRFGMYRKIFLPDFNVVTPNGVIPKRVFGYMFWAHCVPTIYHNLPFLSSISTHNNRINDIFLPNKECELSLVSLGMNTRVPISMTLPNDPIRF